MFKYSATFSLLPATKKDGTHTIRLRVTSCGDRITQYLPYSITVEAWDDKKCRAKANYANGHITSQIINKAINNALTTIDDYFTRADLDGKRPDLQELARLISNKSDDLVDKSRSTFQTILHEFVKTNGASNSWTKETYQKFGNLERHLMAYNPKLTMLDFDEKGLSGYVSYLHSIGLRNTTITKYYDFLKWFLRWAYKHGYLQCLDFENYRPRLKGVSSAPRAQLFLEWDEVMALYNFDYGTRHRGLAAVRDVFLFQCFSGLRYSDVKRLKRENVFDDHISLVMQKTSEPVTIELNSYTKEILGRYASVDLPNNSALPVISNVKMNTEIKEACRLAGITKPTQIVYYKGSERFDDTQPKCNLVSTHCGRRTFVVHALNLGIPATTVMKWTGHSSYDSMRPYVEVSEQGKKEAMEKFNKQQ